MSAQTAADLRAAADILRRDGWTQGWNGTCGGPKCAAGAVVYAITDGESVDEIPEGIDNEEERDERVGQALGALAREVGERASLFVPRYNDAENRTADEVIAALEAAAQAAEQQAAA